MDRSEIIEQAKRMEGLRKVAKDIEDRLSKELYANYRPFELGDIRNGSYGYGSERRDFAIEYSSDTNISVEEDGSIEAWWRISGGIIKIDGSISEHRTAYTIETIKI